MSNPVQREFDRQNHDRPGSNPYEPGDFVETPYARERLMVVLCEPNAVWVKNGYLGKARVLLDLVGR